MQGKMVLADTVRILDISRSGIALKADRRLNLGCTYIMSISTWNTILNVKGTVIWSLLSENKPGTRNDIVPVYTAGMKFTDVSQKKGKEIDAFIASLCKGEETKPNLTGAAQKRHIA
jgi:hypothetical protein